ncbi:AraC family transcriptional regulator [Gloeocapsopsis sp. IPPAS B-1203]|uniref:AraC family transcriptional regulator n=1 Tax=Gloeocapsopsis sp. IPPAS B-1203 TaxID=2049454 RepID=UPI000C176353|nr:AraC family transcriptional regulator [Gloeocapsopsis sp. IPPAS B-1203]PIG90722.1 AraC family transcriptional regulator [Gloeocapsopsis sp. IPPAS B-1203]
MTISMSEQAADDLYEEMLAHAKYPDPKDDLDLLLHCPSWLSEGYVREIELREGLELRIDNFRLCDRWEVTLPEEEGQLCFHFHLSGQHLDAFTEVSNLEYALYGSGLSPKQTIVGPCEYHSLEVIIWMQLEVLLSFIGAGGELPTELQHLIRQQSQRYYTRVGTISPAMQRILWQIIRCPYQGLHKRMYLEGKVLEVAALVLEEEQEVQQGRRSQNNLKPDYIDRIHRAREILKQNLHQPPSLITLARQVGLNDCSLKRGFRYCFGKTVFGYLHDYRMEQASQLLMSGDMRVTEVMQAVGFGDRKYFAAAFRKKFGVSPRDYLKIKF